LDAGCQRALLGSQQKVFYDSNHVQIITPVTECARLSLTMDSDREPLLVARRRRCFSALVAGALVLVAVSVRAQGAPPAGATERRVKAAFLYKFLGYTEFPASAFADPAAPVVIGVIGADELAAELARIVAGRTVGARPITVKLLREGDSAAGVHLLFVGANSSARLRTIVKTAQPGPILVVSEAEDGLEQGSVINFRVVDERVRFDVSLEAAEKNSVKLSSRLLTVANHVQKGAP
jgi:hypothetical protein